MYIYEITQLAIIPRLVATKVAAAAESSKPLHQLAPSLIQITAVTKTRSVSRSRVCVFGCWVSSVVLERCV